MPPQPLPTVRQLRYKKVLTFLDDIEANHTAQLQILTLFYSLGFVLLLLYCIILKPFYLMSSLVILGLAAALTLLFSQPFLQYQGIREQVVKDLEEGLRMES